MGISSQAYDFFHRIRITDDILLRQYADFPCDLCRFEGMKLPPFPADASGIRYTLSDGFNQSGFAGAVRPCQHQPLAFLQMKGKIVHNRMAAVADSNPIPLQHPCHLAFLVR